MISLSQASLSSPPPLNVNWGSTRSETGWTGWAPHDTGASQADPVLVVGSDRLLTAVEGQFSIFFDPWHGDDHYGNFGSGLGEWLGPGLPQPVEGFYISQPQLLIDPAAPDGLGHLVPSYILIARAARNSDKASRLVIGSSHWTGPVEFGAWDMWSLDENLSHSSALYARLPRIGMTSNVVIVTADMYSWNDDTFQFSQIWLIPKAEIYPGGTHRFHTFWGFNNANGSAATSLVPATSYVDSTITYLVNSYNPGNGTANELSVWTLDTQDPFAPIFQGQTLVVDNFSVPPDAQQKGTDVLITTWDASITNAVLQPSGLWVAQGTGQTPDGDTVVRSCVRWYQLDPVTPGVVQQGTLGFPGAHFYYPTVSANATGDMTLAFSASADYANVGLYYSGRRASDPANTPSGFAPNSFALLRDGEGCYVRPGPYGWNVLGGRTAVALDLSDGRSMWIFGAYAAGSSADCRSNGWGTWLGRVTW
jgi:hypothetical protein